MQGCGGRDITRALQPGHIGVATDGAGGGAGRIEQNGIKGCGGLPACGISGHDFRLQLQPRQVFTQPARALCITLHCRDLRPRRSKLRCLAAGGCAKISDAFARARRQQAGGQGSGGVLHPEGALGKAGDFRHAGAGRQAIGPAGQGFRAL